MIECGRLPACSCCHEEALFFFLASPERMSGRTAPDNGSGITPPTIMSPASELAGPSTEIRLGVSFFLRVWKPASHPRLLLLCERGPPEEWIDLEVQTMYPAFDAWVLYR
jgi:hypothetical protein